MNAEITANITESIPHKGGKLNKTFPELKFERENSYFYQGELENMKFVKKKI